MVRNIFSSENGTDIKNIKIIMADLIKLQAERKLTEDDLKVLKFRIKQAQLEFTKISANLEKTKSDFEILLTQQMLNKKEILQLEKEHKFILTELASLTGKKQSQIIESPSFTGKNLYSLLKEAIRDVMREQAENKSKSSMKEEYLIKKQGTQVEHKKQKDIALKNRFRYF